MYELTQNEVKRKMSVWSVCDDVGSHWSDERVGNFAEARCRWSMVVGRWQNPSDDLGLRATMNEYRPTTNDCFAAAKLLDADRHL